MKSPGASMNAAGWRLSNRGQQALARAKELRLSNAGFYHSIPILCKGSDCPYADTCALLEEGLAPAGEKCPMEIAAVEQLFDAYVQELKVEPGNIVDLSLIKELVDLDIAILRCDNRLAIDADFIQEVAVAVTPKGFVISKPELHKAADYKGKLMEKRHKVLNLLNSTRKDKAGSKLTIQYDPSVRAAELLEKAREFWEKEQRKNQAVDVEVVQ